MSFYSVVSIPQCCIYATVHPCHVIVLLLCNSVVSIPHMGGVWGGVGAIPYLYWVSIQSTVYLYRSKQQADTVVFIPHFIDYFKETTV